MSTTQIPGRQTDQRKTATLLGSEWLIDFVAIAFLWSVAVLIVNPIGNFPLNDDWAMATTVKRLVEDGLYRPSGWTGMPLITQTLWGALFCIPFGFSFTALRFSTLVISLTGVFGTYCLIRQLRRSRLVGILCALTLGCNPIYFALSNTFMTDVPFTTLVILAALFFVRFLQKGSDRDLLIGTAFAVAATLCRQLGLFVPLGFGATLLLTRGFQKRWLLRAFIPAVVSISVLAAFQHWLAATGRLPALYYDKSGKLLSVLSHPLRLPLNFAYYGWSILMYLGCFLLPVTIYVALTRRHGERYSRLSSLARFALLLFLAASVVRFIVVPSLMPVHNNVIIRQGIGPPTLKDTQDLHLDHLPGLPVGFWLVVTGLSLLGAGLLILDATTFIFGRFTKPKFDPTNADRVLGTFFLICTVAYLLPLLISGFFDRYLVPILPFLAAFAVVSLPEPSYRLARAPLIASMLLILGSGIFAIAGTRDYLEWNRTRWIALEALLSREHARPQDVDGGFEFNGWYSYESFGKTNWWVVKDTYALSFGEMEGYEPKTQYTYSNWMPPRIGKIFVMKRKSGSPKDGEGAEGSGKRDPSNAYELNP